ncbi:hypothetical protein Nepgr_008788 [Nepenthes gracilis]|uniref:Uncharacterized protein n=1 Tax=Nepenthes gracilis TaxID=150966 RepID=A0AAD3S9A9_NEPGR|nr:hypothetical protein Nepgr_008788 [Nepenthes gracilis]
MGRSIPMEEIKLNYSLLASNLTLSFHVAWIAALIALIGGLCGTCFRKNHSPKTEKACDAAASVASNPLPQATITTTSTTITPDTTQGEDVQKPLPPPPVAVVSELGGELAADRKRSPPQIDRSSTLHNYMSKSASRRKLSDSISMRMPGARSMRQTRDDLQKKLKHEDSLLTKRILIGEKCRLPTQGDDGDAHQNATANPQTELAEAVPMSRSNSSVEYYALSSQEEKSKEKGREGSVDDRGIL